MKSIYKKYIKGVWKVSLITLTFTASLSSCSKDFLNLRPELDIPEDNMFDTPERILTHVQGLYASAKDGRLMAGRYYIYNDIRAEEFINRTTNGVTGLAVYNHTNDAATTQVNNFWIQAYMTINRVNKFLEDFDKYPGVVSPELEANYRGEAKFVRAWMYYVLVHMFATPYVQDNGASPGLPLRLQAETNSENNSLPRSTVAEVYAQILSDLTDAESGLPENYGNPTLRTTRAHKNTAIALKTRIYLAMGDYANVITEGNKIVSANAPFTSASGVPHALQDNVQSVFITPYTTTENILSMPFADTNAPGTQNQIGYYYNAGNIEYYINTSTDADGGDPITGIYTNPQWSDTDDRKTLLTEDYALSATNTIRILTKWSGESPFIDWVPVIRYAEVLLNLAEAEAEVGDQARALALVNAVHARSDANNLLTSSDQADLINKILTERRIELLGEGFRAPDLMRRGQSILSYGAGGSISPTSSSYIFPIPVGEEQTNPDL